MIFVTKKAKTAKNILAKKASAAGISTASILAIIALTLSFF